MTIGCPPTKFKPHIVKAILEDIAEGVPYQIAAETHAVSERCFYKWVENGKKDIDSEIESDHASFVQSLREIESKRIKKAFENIHASDKGHRGYEWSMERSFWKYFSAHAQNLELNERVENLEKSKENK